jgi:hypothetical protein
MLWFALWRNEVVIRDRRNGVWGEVEMNAFVLRAACLLAMSSATAFAQQQTIPFPTGGPGTSPYDTRATVDYNQSSYSLRNVPQVSAPGLTTTLSDTCMGSASFGVSVTGFGATAGTTRVDEACVRRLDAREFRAMGLPDVALALLCQSEADRRAVEATGHLCPGTTAPLAKVGASSETASLTDDEKYRDPLVRDRLGLPSLNTADAKPAPASKPQELKPPPSAGTTEVKPPPSVSPKYQRSQPPDVKPDQPQVANVNPAPAPRAPVSASAPIVPEADALEQKIKNFGWRPVAKQNDAPVTPDGVVSSAAR